MVTLHCVIQFQFIIIIALCLQFILYYSPDSNGDVIAKNGLNRHPTLKYGDYYPDRNWVDPSEARINKDSIFASRSSSPFHQSSFSRNLIFNLCDYTNHF